jgi:hypothetical protein
MMAKYVIAWFLGVPAFVLVLVYLFCPDQAGFKSNATHIRSSLELYGMVL